MSFVIRNSRTEDAFSGITQRKKLGPFTARTVTHLLRCHLLLNGRLVLPPMTRRHATDDPPIDAYYALILAQPGKGVDQV